METQNNVKFNTGSRFLIVLLLFLTRIVCILLEVFKGIAFVFLFIPMIISRKVLDKWTPYFTAFNPKKK